MLFSRNFLFENFFEVSTTNSSKFAKFWKELPNYLMSQN